MVYLAQLTFIFFGVLLLSCSSVNGPRNGGAPDLTALYPYPDFITANKDYFTTRIDDVPHVDADSFRLEITGLVKRPQSFSLGELRALSHVTLPLTVECIGNSSGGDLLGTAVWKGFRLYDLLASLGLDSGATGVKYRCADGYYASHTMDQVKNNGVIGALYMNGDTIPPEQGFPLRILNPGYYGAKQPAWVVGIEVTGLALSDYWGDRGWDVSPPIAIDSKIFFPLPGDSAVSGDTVPVGGAAFGGMRVDKVEVSSDAGATWRRADIIKSMDADNVWAFWLAKIVLPQTGVAHLYARATDVHGSTQPQNDTNYSDGNNNWPGVIVSVLPRRP
jgi:DMSO/TMAO reductase YedYZ molybdopterin-dependent catalytic subunit